MKNINPDNIFKNVDEATGICHIYIANALPTKIKGVVQEKRGQQYVIINANCSYEEQIDAYEHEMKHLENNDLDSELTADEIEAKY